MYFGRKCQIGRSLVVLTISNSVQCSFMQEKMNISNNCCRLGSFFFFLINCCRLGLWPNNIVKYGNEKETQHNCISLGINRYITLQDFDSYRFQLFELAISLLILEKHYSLRRLVDSDTRINGFDIFNSQLKKCMKI